MSDSSAETAETTEQAEGVPPLSEEVHEVADRIVRRYPVARSALLPLLHLVQSEQNHITDAGIAFCAEKVGLTRAEVGAVATFYTMFKREPVGDWLLSVCTNPPCKIAGGQQIYDDYVDALDGKHVDPETKVMVEHAECLGICDGAPVVQVNYEMYGPMTVEEGSQLLAACRRGDPPESPWSGEKPPRFNEVERDLSGANDAWEAELHRAALQQIAYDDPPTYRTGETDIPVTHPGGDPAGVGGALFRQQATGNGQSPAEADPDDVAPTADIVADRDPREGDDDQPLAGDDSQRIAPGESDDSSIATAGAGTPTAEDVDVHPPDAEAIGGFVPGNAEAMTKQPGPGDQPGDVGVLGRGSDEARVTATEPSSRADTGEDESDGPEGEPADATGDEADVAPGASGDPTGDAAAEGLPSDAADGRPSRGGDSDDGGDADDAASETDDDEQEDG